MSIFRPQLPPKAGYVEVLDEDGITHIYAPTAETLRKIEEAAAFQVIQNDMDDMLVDYEYRITLLELGLEVTL